MILGQNAVSSAHVESFLGQIVSFQVEVFGPGQNLQLILKTVSLRVKISQMSEILVRQDKFGSERAEK